MPGQQRGIDIILYNVSLNCNLPGKPSLFAVADKKKTVNAWKCLLILYQQERVSQQCTLLHHGA